MNKMIRKSIKSLTIPILLIVFVSFSLLGQTADNIVINEFLSSNNTSVLDPDFNQYADWIELYNQGANAVDLSGYYLTDNLASPQKWIVPNGTIIPADGYLLIWADGMDVTDVGLHTNFKLSNSGEEIGLFDNAGSLIDSYIFEKQVTDVSMGRSHSNPVEWLFFSDPTPGTANLTAGLSSNLQSTAPVVSLKSGFYRGSQTVTLTSSSGGTIHYTTDGSIPDSQSPTYGSPLSISVNTVLKARVLESNRLASPIISRSYFINEQTTLPVFSLSVDPDNLWSNEKGIYNNQDISQRDEWKRPAHIDFFETNGNPGFNDDIDIRLFGRTAIYLPQKSLGIFLSNELDYPLFGWGGIQKYYSFVLRSSSDDWHLTMFRDAFIQTMVRKNLNLDTQNYRPAILFINGEYWGIHNIREKYNEDYLATHHAVDPNNVDLLYLDLRPQGGVEVIAGDLEQYNALIDFVENHDLAIPSNYDIVANLMNIDNFIDYVIAETFVGNTSWAHNIRMWRPRTAAGKWEWLFYDTDRGFRDRTFNALDEMSQMLSPFRALLDNENFRQQFLQRYSEYLNAGFQPDRVTSILDSLQAGIAAEIPRHSERWKNECGNNVCGIPSMSTWQESVATMRSIVQERPAIVRQQLIDLFGLEQTDRLDIQVSPPGYGVVRLGQHTVIDGNYSGVFFKNSTIDLYAEANDGYLFSGWRGSSSTTHTLLVRGSEWKYFDNGTFPGASWNSAAYDDNSWKTGAAQLGYGDGDETTVVDYGSNSNNKYTTTYFRTSFQIADISDIQSLNFKLLRDDGAIVYLNGREVVRSNMPSGTVEYSTLASSTVSGGDEDAFFEFTVGPEALLNGINYLAVEIHQITGSSSDISFDLELDAISNGGGSSDFISYDPELPVTIDQNRSLSAVFTMNADNILATEISTNTTLTAANSPYFVLANLTVKPDVTLTIEPGAEIQLSDGANIYINGQLLANGSENSPVIIKGTDNAKWGALCIEDATGPSLMSYTNIDGATTGADALHYKAAVSTYNSDLTLDHVSMRNVQQPFYGHGGVIIVSNSSLDGTGAGDDMMNIQYASAIVENCHLFGNGELDFDYVNDGIIRNTRIDIISTNSNRDGIDIGTSQNVLIENNQIFDCPDKGISVGEKSTAIIRGNLVVNTSMAVAVKDSSVAEIDRNTFFSDSIGVACYEKNAGQGGGSASVRNTIFAAMRDAEFSVDSKSSVQITYSLSDQNLLTGTGNILGNPLFISPNADNFHLQPGSPGIDAGDPDSPIDPDDTRADIGAYYYNQNPADYSMLYINELMPFNSQTIADNFGEYEDWIEIYNRGNQPIDLGGLYMSDDIGIPTLFRLSTDDPEQTTVPPGGFLVLWSDDNMEQGANHLGFRLNHEGEQIALVQLLADSVVFIDSISFGPLADDHSFGRREDGDDTWIVFSNPTPGSSNNFQNSTTDGDNLMIPRNFAISQNYPNPFNPTTTIKYQLPKMAVVAINIFDLRGNRVTVLVDQSQTPGYYSIEWNGRDYTGRTVPNGVYFCQFIANSDGISYHKTKKMMMLK